MAFTKVVGPGIHTLSNIASHNINSSGIITATQFDGPFSNVVVGGGTTISSDGINVTGIVTATGLDVNGNGDISGNLVIGGNLTANGDFTTLNTTLREVELLRVDANNDSLTAGIITQRGSGDILNLFDTSTEVLTVKDGGNLGVGTISPTHVLHSYGEGNLGGVRLENSHSTTTVSGNTAATAFPHNLILSNYSGLNSANDRIASIGFDVPTTGSYANATIAYQATSPGAGDLQFHLESGNVISERIRFTSSGKILTGNPVTPAHAESASLIVVSANASSGANMLSDSSAVYNHNNPSFLAVQNRYDTGTDQESGIILSQKHSQQGSWAIYGKRTGSYVSDLIFRNRTAGSASAERLRIDSSGRLLIGRSSAYAHADADNLIVGNEATNEHQGITILSHTGKYGGIYFGDGDGATGSNRGKIIYDHPNDQLRIGTGGAAATQFYITSTGKVGVNEGSPLAKLHVKEGDSGVSSADAEQDTLFLENNGNAGLTIATPNANTGYLTFADPEDSNVGQIIYRHGGTYANSMAFFVNAAERLAITSGGQVRIGNANNLALWGQNNRLQVAGTDWSSSGISIACMGSSGNANLVFGQSRGSTPGTSINAGDRLGYISFVGDDGTDMYTVGAAIVVDTSNQDTVSSNNIPGRIRFYTGGNTPDHERLSINSSGKSIFYEEIETPQDYPNFRPVFDFNFAATKKLKPEMTFAREGEASFHDGVGSVKFVSNNEPRFEHDIITGECKGLMFEGPGTNYSWYSMFFKSSGYSAGSWVPVNGGATPTITENTHTAPDGTSSGYYMADTISGANGTAFNGNVVKQEHTAGANVKHTLSIYIKLLTSTQATIYIRDGATGSTASANAIPNTRNWQRVVVTSNNALTNGTNHAFYIGNTNGTIAVWGSQIERSDYASSYIKTTGGANGTRTADNGGVRLDGEDITDVFNQGEGTLIAEAIPTDSITNQGLVGFYQDFGDVNRIELRTQGTNTANARFESVVGSSSVVTMTGSAHAGINNVSKYAYAFQENNYASTVNGGTVQTDTNGAFPHGTGINSMIIGDSVYSQNASVIIKRIMYYADRLPNSQLVTLTS